jgi:hypothetical protein
MLELAMGNKNKNNKRFIEANKMYCTVDEEESIKYYAFHDFKKPRFTINDII